MYQHTTSKLLPVQGLRGRTRGFTLVEIMIVIVIILLLSQMGNVGGLFSTRNRSRVEEIAVGIISFIDAEKVDALLGKTEEGAIVRKRKIDLDLDNTAHEIILVSEVNLASEAEGIYNPETKKQKSWTLERLEGEIYGCTTGTRAAPLGIYTATIELAGDSIEYSTSAGSLPAHVVLLLKQDTTSHEIHIDRRTGLTYERRGQGRDSGGEWSVLCN